MSTNNLNTDNPILFLLASAEIFKNVVRIHNYNGQDYLTVVDVDIELEDPIDWRHLQSIRGELCEKSIYLDDFTVPSLPSDFGADVLFVNKDFTKTSFGPLAGYYSTSGQGPMWRSRFDAMWDKCYKLKMGY